MPVAGAGRSLARIFTANSKCSRRTSEKFRVDPALKLEHSRLLNGVVPFHTLDYIVL